MEFIHISKKEIYEIVRKAIREELEDFILTLFEEEEISEKEKKEIEKIIKENEEEGFMELEEFLNAF